MIPLLLLLTAAAQQDDALVLPISGANRMLLIAEEWEASGDHAVVPRSSDKGMQSAIDFRLYKFRSSIGQ